MSASAEYVAYISELLVGFADLQQKKYFGGVAFHSSDFGKDTQFAVVLNDILYFVVDDSTRPEYEEKGMQPFRYQKQDKTVVVRKWYSVPEDCFDDEGIVMEWANKALRVATELKG